MDISQHDLGTIRGFAPITPFEQYKKTIGCRITHLFPNSYGNCTPDQSETDLDTFLQIWDGEGMAAVEPGFYSISRAFVEGWREEGVKVVAVPHPTDKDDTHWSNWYASISVDLGDGAELVRKFRDLWRSSDEVATRFINTFGSPFHTDGTIVVPLDLLRDESRLFDTFCVLRAFLDSVKGKADILDGLIKAMEEHWSIGYRELRASEMNIMLVMQGPDYRNLDYIRELTSDPKYDLDLPLDAPSPDPSGKYLDQIRALRGIVGLDSELRSYATWKQIAEEFAYQRIKAFLHLQPRLERYGLRIAPRCLIGHIWAIELEDAYGDSPPAKCPHPHCKNYITSDGTELGTKKRRDAKTCGLPGCKRWYSRNRHKLGME